MWVEDRIKNALVDWGRNMYSKHSLNRNCNIQTKSDHHKTYMHG